MTSQIYFADAWYWVALTNPKDQSHNQAKLITNAIKNSEIVTSEMVLTEYLSTYGEWGEYWRGKCCDLVDRIRSNHKIDVIHQTSEWFDRGLQRYRTFLDKEWSLTDCCSMEIMQERGITHVLTGDHHFQQAGFILAQS